MLKLVTFAMFCLACCAGDLNAQTKIEESLGRSASISFKKRERFVEGSVTQLSPGTIFITIADSEPHYILDNLNKSLDAKNLKLFLNAFYTSSKATRTNDIVIRSKTKRLVSGESEVKKLMESLSKKYGINVVYMPPPTGYNADAALQEFARRNLK